MKRLIKKMFGIGEKNEKARDAWVNKTLSALPAGLKILDAGAGEGRYKKQCEHLVYVSQDFAQYDGKGDSVGLQTGTWDQSKLDIVSDITAIPVPDGSFDAILCTEVFEHIPDPVDAIKEFSRLLKKGGHLIITAPFCSLTHFAPYHYYSGFNKYFYQKQLGDHGFEIDEIVPNGNYFDYVAQELARLPYMAKQHSTGNIFPWHYILWGLTLISLKKFSRKDKGSADLLCFGFHVRATKKEL